MHECVEATIVGRIYNGDIRTLFPDIANAFAAETWEWPWTDEGETEIWGLCMNGATFELPSSNQTINEEREGIQFQRYYIKLQVNDVTGEVIKACGDKNKLKGFYLTAEMNQNYNTTDETHAIGASGTTGKDLGTLDTFERTKTTIPTANLISLERLTNGVNLDIDAGAIKNID
ncbi:MAG TPA: hypothetical protein VEA18_01490 [Candidatus Kapabacteria bacterium]|nr:hypothetical protein [Candidatus Kapabacteria bacterium]